MATAVNPETGKPRVPSARNQQIWLQVTVDGLTQTAAAEKFGMAQSRVSRIVKKVAQWVAAWRPLGGGRWTPTEQISYANQVAGSKLQKQLDLAEANYAKSQQETLTVKVKDFCEVEGEGDQEKEKVVRRTRETTKKTVPQGDFRFLNQQQKLTKDIREVGLAQAQLPPLPPPPSAEKFQLTPAQNKRLQRCIRNWHNQQMMIEASRVGRTLFLWPDVSYIYLDWYNYPLEGPKAPDVQKAVADEYDAIDNGTFHHSNYVPRYEFPTVEDAAAAAAAEGYNYPKSDYDPSFQFPREGEVTTNGQFENPPDGPAYSDAEVEAFRTSELRSADPYAPRQISEGVTWRPYTPEEARSRAEWDRQQCSGI
jgi:hypothetical protein